MEWGKKLRLLRKSVWQQADHSEVTVAKLSFDMLLQALCDKGIVSPEEASECYAEQQDLFMGKKGALYGKFSRGSRCPPEFNQRDSRCMYCVGFSICCTDGQIKQE